MSITTLISQSELIALGWTLLHFCWQGTAIAVAYSVVDRLTSRAASNVRYAVALIALALMPLTVAATYTLELQVAQQQVSSSAPAAITELPAQHVILQEITFVPEQALTPSLTSRSAWFLNRAQLALPFIDGIWMLGVLLLAIRAAGGWLQLERIRLQAAHVVPSEVKCAFHRMHHRLDIGREVALRISGEVISPLAMGLWHTTIILPVSAVLRLSAAELEAVLAHELGHIRRWDYAVNLLQTAVESVLFFHPAVWRLSRTVRERREICCDEIAVQACANPIVYAQALLRMEEQRTLALHAAVALNGCGGSLLERVRKILGESRPMENLDSKMTSGVRVAAAATVVMALLLGPMLFDSKTSTAVAAPHISTPTITALPAAPQAAQAPTPAATPAPAATTAPTAEPVPTPGPAVAPIAPIADPAPMPIPAPRVKVKVAPIAPIDLDSQVDVNVNVDIPKVKLKELQLKDMDIKLKSKELKVMNEQMKIQSQNMVILSRDMALKSKDIQLSILSANNRMMLGAGFQSVDGKPTPSGTAYIDGMKDAGYPLDLNNDLHSLIALKSVGVTPEYAKAMNNVGLGKPTAHDLITLKAMGVTPEYVATLKQQGVTPLTVHDVVSMKAQHVSPEYITWFKQHFPDADMSQMRKASIFHIDDKFLAQAKTHGFDDRNLDKLIRLKISGLLDD